MREVTRKGRSAYEEDNKPEVIFELKPGQPLTARQKQEIRALMKLPKDRIDTSDIPELPQGAWKNAVRGKWYRPVR